MSFEHNPDWRVKPETFGEILRDCLRYIDQIYNPELYELKPAKKRRYRRVRQTEPDMNQWLRIKWR